MSISLSGHIVDPVNQKIFAGSIYFKNGVITGIERRKKVPSVFIMPGWIDSHIHIESSMLTPECFSNTAVRHGTTGIVSDPHEISNILGERGIRFMLKSAANARHKIWFGVPSCVPATSFESSGAEINAQRVKSLLKKPELRFLSEMMNFPGVIAGDTEVHLKIQAALELGKPVDGHAPGLTGKDLDNYISAGISTDHECFTLEEGEEKIKKGMLVLIREGSAARNFDTLCSLIDKYPGKTMLCSDDLHPDDLLKGHLNLLLERGVKKGVSLFNLLQSVTSTPVRHYNLNGGLLQTGDPADMVVTSNISDFQVLETWVDGVKVYDINQPVQARNTTETINKFHSYRLRLPDIRIPATRNKVKVIKAIDGELITEKESMILNVNNGFLCTDTQNDILKIVVVNRYKKAKPAVGFITGFGMKSGAIASSIAHDSHNIVGVGVEDQQIINAVNWIMEQKGGLCVASGMEVDGLPLPVAGIMTNKDASSTAELYSRLNNKASNLGSPLRAPFMTLSFMSLLVIPHLKLGDRGLFDVDSFAFTSLYEP